MRSVRGHFDRLSDEQYGQLLSVVLNEDDPESTSSLATVVVGWAQHVRRLHDELDDLSDRDTLWREYDFYAALDIRSRVRTLLIKSPSSARALVRPLVEASDAEFVSFTVVDDRDLVTELGLPVPDDRPWWWQRVPQRGPPRAGLEDVAALVDDQESRRSSDSTSVGDSTRDGT